MGRKCIPRIESDQGVQPETWADAEVEMVDERDKNQRKAATNDAAGSTTANNTGNSAGEQGCHDAAIGRTPSPEKQLKRKPQCHSQEEHRREFQGH